MPTLQRFIHRGYDPRLTAIQTDGMDLRVQPILNQRLSEVCSVRHLKPSNVSCMDA